MVLHGVERGGRVGRVRAEVHGPHARSTARWLVELEDVAHIEVVSCKVCATLYSLVFCFRKVWIAHP